MGDKAIERPLLIGRSSNGRFANVSHLKAIRATTVQIASGFRRVLLVVCNAPPAPTLLHILAPGAVLL